VSAFALIVFTGVRDDGKVEEMTREADDIEHVGRLLRELVEDGMAWKAVTVVHIEDYPRMMDGALQESMPPMPGSKNKCGHCGEDIIYVVPVDEPGGSQTGPGYWIHESTDINDGHEAVPANMSSS
jgi:hypothetical protein